MICKGLLLSQISRDLLLINFDNTIQRSTYITFITYTQRYTWRRQWHPLQYSCLENPMDGGAWWAAVHGVARSWTQLSNFTFTFHFHALEKEMATHSSVLAWGIPGTGEPGGLPSLGSHRVPLGSLPKESHPPNTRFSSPRKCTSAPLRLQVLRGSSDTRSAPSRNTRRCRCQEKLTKALKGAVKWQGCKRPTLGDQVPVQGRLRVTSDGLL